MFPNINDYTYSCQQINHAVYRVNVVTPDKVKMYIDIKSQGFPPPPEFIFSLIQNKDTRKQFVVELEEIKPAPVEEIKREEKPIEPEINIDLPPESDKVEEKEIKRESTINGLTQAAKEFVDLNGEALLKAAEMN